MNICINLDYDFPESDLEIDFILITSVGTTTKKINLKQKIQIVDIDFEVNDKVNQTFTLSLKTDNPQIIKHPVHVTKIILDNFYQRLKFAHSGQPVFDQSFLEYADKNKIYLDHSVTDSNRLDFTGNLDFCFQWPCWRNLL